MRDLALNLYEAVLDNRPWQPALGALVRAAGGHSAMVLIMQDALVDLPHAAPSNVVEAVNFDPGKLAEYAQHWVQRDPWVEASLRNPDGQLREIDRLVPSTEFARSAIYNELKPDVFHCLASVLQYEAGVAGFALHRTRRQGAFSPEQIARAGFLIPHARRALDGLLRLRAGGFRQAARSTVSLAAALGAVALPCALLDRFGRLAFANPAFEALCAAEPSIAMGAQGRLHFADRAAAVRIDSALTAGGAAEIMVVRPSGVPLRLTLMPAGREGFLLQVQLAPPATSPAELLALQYRLTRAEMTLCDALLQGLTLRAHAENRGVSIHTARAQLKSLLGKVGVDRQAGLFVLVQRTKS